MSAVDWFFELPLHYKILIGLALVFASIVAVATFIVLGDRVFSPQGVQTAMFWFSLHGIVEWFDDKW